MVEIRVCAKCRKAFYTGPREESSGCSYCGYYFIQRSRERVSTVIDFTLSIDDKKMPAVVKNYSEGGAMILYMGEYLPVNGVVHLKVDALSLNRAAKTVWSKKIDESRVASGIRLL